MERTEPILANKVSYSATTSSTPMTRSDIADHLNDLIIRGEDGETTQHATSIGAALNIIPASTIKISGKFSHESFLKKSIEQDSLDSAFCVVDLAEIVHSVTSWRQEVPRIEPVFSLAANPDEAVLRVLQSQDVSFSVATSRELPHTKKFLDMPLLNIMDFNGARGDKYTRSCVAAGVNTFLVNSRSDLMRICKFSSSASIMINLNCFDVKKESALKEILSILNAATALHFEVAGVYTSITHEKEHSDLYSRLKSILDTLNATKKVFSYSALHGFCLKKIHLSGSFVDSLVHTSTEDNKFLFTLNSCLNQCFPLEEFPLVSISADANDALVASSHTVAAVITGTKHGSDESMYYIDDGIYGSFHSCMIGPHMEKKIVPLPLPMVSTISRGSDVQITGCTIWGPTCDSLDVIGKGIPLPRLTIGDWMYFKSVGSFSIANGTEFNGVANPQVRYVFSF